jgi:hypothetical protein
MLDRAVTISVRFFVLFALIYIVFAIPLTLFQYFGTADFAKIFGSFADALAKAGKDQSALAKALAIPPVFNAFTVLYFVMAAIVGPLPSAALMWSAAEIYGRGNVPTFAEAYREALRCWLPLIGVTLLWVASALLAYVALVFFVVLVGLAILLLYAVLKVAGVVAAVVGGIATVAAIVVVVSVCLLAAYMAYMAVVVERVGFITAFASGISRVFARSLRRSVLVAITLSAVLFAVSMMGGLIQVLLYGVIRSNALGTAFSAVLNLVAVVFTSVYVAVYYYDIRMRAEGLDLERAAEPVAADAVPR